MFLPKFLFIVLLLFGSARTQEAYRVDRIHFTGNRTIKDDELREQLEQKDRRGLSRLLFWKKGDTFNRQLVDRDIDHLERFYQREGFLQVGIQSEIQIFDDKEAVTLVFRIDEGEPARIDSIAFVLVRADSASQACLQAFDRDKFLLSVSDRFRDSAFEVDRSVLAGHFSGRGYPFVKVSPEFQLDTAGRPRVGIIYQIDSGPLCYFGSTRVVGNRFVSESPILKQLAFREGERFSNRRLLQSQKQVYQLGLFHYVVVRVVREELEQGVLPVEVQVREAPRLTFKYGVGYGREEQFRTFVDITRLALFGQDLRFRLFLRHSSLEPYHVNATWTKPAFLFPRTSLSINPFIRREREPGFTIDRIGSNFGLQNRMDDRTDLSFKYAFEQDRLSLSSSMRRDALKDLDITLYNKSTIEFGFFSDRSQPVFYPSRGYFVGWTAALSGIGFRSDFHYWRSLLEWRRYT
ncbi:BamA/TamA family outer membrane protein, partial [candidate division KSB1 bacterium]|nr:BamA/TamA family outer membrane protein [candidate division KSB1 bacterium]